MTAEQKPGPAPRACEVCRRRDGLLRCSGCQAVYYCSQPHQASDRTAHKRGCLAVKKARATLAAEEQKLREMPGDMFLPANVFETGVGRFWGLFETRPYMRARYGLADTLLHHFGSRAPRVAAVEAALAHMLDMLRLCRGDNMGIRDIVPSLYVALGRDQEAYDFMKWWATKAEESDFDWGDMSLPYLDIKDADVLEPPVYWTTRWVKLAHASIVVLIKLRILLDLQSMQSATRAFTGILPPEIIQGIRRHLVGDVVSARPEMMMGDLQAVARHMRTVRGQVLQLHRSIHKANPYFWNAMKGDPVAEGKTRPPHYSPGSEAEAYLTIGYTDVAWRSSPRALDTINELSIRG